jgi:23S rRNA pseudouridine955/2504/2580 synthase
MTQKLNVLFENENYLVVNKPWGIASLDEHVFTTPSMLRLLKKMYPDAQLCHRLDKETSGCLLASKNPEAYRHAAIQFEKRTIEKLYTAFCCGSHQFDQLSVDLPLFMSNKRVKISHKKGKASQTILQTITRFKHFSIVSCKPLTGRLHQIRVHLYSQNASIVNDKLYSGCTPLMSQIKKKGFKLPKNEEETPIISRLSLHAASIGLHDLDGTLITVEAPLSKELAAFEKILQTWDQL